MSTSPGLLSPPAPPPRPLLLGRTLLAYAAALLVAGWAFELWQIRTDRLATLQAARNDLTTLAGSLSNELSAMINDGVGAAMAATNEIDRAVAPDTARMTQTLANMLTGGEYVREVFIVTPSQYVSAARLPPPGGSPTPPWANTLFAAGMGDSFVGGVLVPQQDDAKAVFPIARRVTKDGKSIWAGAWFSIESLHRVYGALPLEGGAVGLISADGIVLMRAPSLRDQQFVGRSVAQVGTFIEANQAHEASILLEGPNLLTGRQRLYAMSRVANYPILATASQDVEAALQPWWSRTQQSLQGAAVSTIAWIALTLGLYAVLRRHYNSLCRSEERFELVTHAANDGIWDWDLPSNRMYYSTRLQENLGYAGNSTLGTAVESREVGTHHRIDARFAAERWIVEDFAPVPETFWALLHPDDLERTRLAMHRHLVEHEPYDLEYRLRMRSGDYRWFKARGQAVWDVTGTATRMAGSISDVHERKVTEASLQQAQLRELRSREEFAQHLLRVQEQERQRLADELHESVGQDLSLIRNRAQLLLQQPSLPRAIADQLQGLADLAAAMIGEIRAVVQDLRPLHIEQLGLTDALDTLLDKMAQAGGLTVERRLEDIDGAVNRVAATHIYRIVQEALDHMLAQGQARRCRVWLERDVHCLRLTIAHDASTARNASKELSLASITERVRMLEATCHIGSSPETCIVIEIPTSESLPQRQPELSSPP